MELPSKYDIEAKLIKTDNSIIKLPINSIYEISTVDSDLMQVCYFDESELTQLSDSASASQIVDCIKTVICKKFKIVVNRD